MNTASELNAKSIEIDSVVSGNDSEKVKNGPTDPPSPGNDGKFSAASEVKLEGKNFSLGKE